MARIEVLWQDLALDVARPARWDRPMRRELEARNAQQSNAIEGHVVTVDDALAAGEGRPMEADPVDAAAVQGYRRAMNFALTDFAQFDLGRILAVHFMMTEHDPVAWPGRWRAGSVQVTDRVQGIAVYEGPPAVLVPDLMEALVEQLNSTDGSPLVRAAIAHLNLVKIHPFRDGNGRCSRALQTAVLGRAGIVAPAFASIEEYLGLHTNEYYTALADAGGPYWQPDRDITSWIRFCLRAHFEQAQLVARDRVEAAALWAALEALRERAGLPERLSNALFNAARGQRIDNAAYRESAPDVSANLASRDLRAAVDAGLLATRGSKRGTSYVAGPPLIKARKAVESGRKPVDTADLFGK